VERDAIHTCDKRNFYSNLFVEALKSKNHAAGGISFMAGKPIMNVFDKQFRKSTLATLTSTSRENQSQLLICK